MRIDFLAIDEGHGYGDAGAVERGTGRQEQAIVREIGKEFRVLLDFNKKKYAVVSIDGGLESRARKANSLGCNAYLSLHMNSSTNIKAYGTEVLIHARGGNAEVLAGKVLNTLVKELGSYKRGVRVAKEYLGHNLAVLSATTMPAILVEHLFLSNKSDMSKYNAKKIALALYRGLYGEPQVTDEIYRVRRTWANAASQKGAFKDLVNAKKCADENVGYSVFDSKGNKVYGGKVITVGSKVRIIGTHYATSKKVSDWAKKQIHTVAQIKGDRALLKEITSWCFIKDLA
ncbi:MAG: N-acetylmuramoyl-L-alanine amidase [Sarcina sp.]